MPTSGTTSGLLSAWLVGPFYGINVVTVVFIVRKLWRRRSSGLIQALLLVTAILISSCTAHAFIYLDDLIRGFSPSHTTSDTQGMSVDTYFLTIGRFNVIACFYLYTINGFLNNLLIAWRVYVTWRRNWCLAAAYVLFNVTALVIIGVICRRFGEGLSLQDWTTRALATSAWALSLTIQTTGAALIAWNNLQTPKVVGDNEPKTFRVPRTLFYACVEAGSPSMVTECFLLAYMFSNLPVALILLALLGQISAFSSFAIILRELYKAELEHSKGFVNVTSALAMHDLPRLRARHSVNSLEGGDGPGDTVMVAIETSRHEDETLKPNRKQYHSDSIGEEEST